MRNATAAFDDDFGSTAAPRRGGARPRPVTTASRKKKKTSRRGLGSMNGVARYVAIGMAATMALGIVVNALVLQKGHHPAPLFAKAAASTPTPVPQTSVAPAAVARAAAVEAPPAVEAAPGKGRKTASRESEPTPSGDAIGRLLAGSAPPPGAKTGNAPKHGAGATKAAEHKNSDVRTVTGVQRALTKLGFKVPATGTAGPATRKAIAAFERDHHLPADGTLDRKLVKLLSTQSGMKID